jgi:hypothetical protein
MSMKHKSILISFLLAMLLLTMRLAAQETEVPDITEAASDASQEAATLVPSETDSPMLTEETTPSEEALSPVPSAETTTELEPTALPPSETEAGIIELTPSSVETETPLPITIEAGLLPEPDLELLLRAEFEDDFDAALWEIPSTAARTALTESNTVLGLLANPNSSTDALRFQNPYQDMAVAVDFKISGGEFRLSLREHEGLAYTVGVSAEAVSLSFGSQVLMSQAIQLELNQWHLLRASIFGDTLRIALDGNEIFASRQATSIFSGKLALSGYETGHLFLDNLSIWLPVTTTPIPTAVPTDVENEGVSAQVINQGNLYWGQTNQRSLAAEGHRWCWMFDGTYPNWLLDIDGLSTPLRYTMHVWGPNLDYTTRSSDTGRGILWRVPGGGAPGNYCVDLIPLSGYSGGSYNITIYSCCKPKVEVGWNQRGWSHSSWRWRIYHPGGTAYVRLAIDAGYPTAYNWALYRDSGDQINEGAAIVGNSANSQVLAVQFTEPAGWYHFHFQPQAGNFSYTFSMRSGAAYTSAASNFSLSNISKNGATLTWTDNSGNEDGYRIYRRLVGQSWGSPLASIAANSTTWTDTSATCNSNYEYQARAHNWNGETSSTVLSALTRRCSPSNDLFPNALVITALALNGTYNNQQWVDTATISAGEPSSTCAANFRASIWYRYTPTVNQQIYLSANSSAYDTVLAVYTGSWGSLNQVACNDNLPSGGTN